MLLVLLAGCSRAFNEPSPPPAPARAELGSPCTDAALCASGHCSDGVCCAAECSESQACDTPGFRGVCTDRAYGSSCSADAQCPGGHCVDGVCCNTACTGNCMTCASDGRAGECELAVDDTDPRRDCGFCMACFSGVCGAAEPGTDPHQECDGGGVCGGDQICRSGALQACGSDADCAVGICLAGSCARSAFSYFDGDPFLPTEQRRAPVAAAVGPGGATALLVITDSYADGVDDVGYLVAMVSRNQDAPWQPVPLSYHVRSDDLAAATWVGHVAFFATGHRATFEPEPTDIVLRGVTLDGAELGTETVSPDAGYLEDLALGSAPDGRLLIGYRTLDEHAHVAVRVSGEGWSLTDLGANSGGIGVASLESGPVAIYLADGGLHARDEDGQDEVAPAFPVPCPPFDGSDNFVGASALRRGDHDVASFVVWCDAPTEAYLLGSYDPAAAQPWAFRLAPTTLAAGGGLGYVDIDYLVPAGGLGGSAIFLADMPWSDAINEPHAPAGGYFSLAWSGEDGGFGALAPFAADPGFDYFDCAAAGPADGVPFVACDTGVQDGSGGSTDVRLLFMRFPD